MTSNVLSVGMTFAQQDGGGGGAGMMVFMVLYIAVILVAIVGVWKVFEKAGKPGWASIVPVYNTIVLTEIIGKPMSWVILILFPCTMPIFIILALIELAKVFGKDTGFGLGLALLGFIFWPILGFGDAKYQGPAPSQN